MPSHHLAQLNTAHLSDALDSPALAEFVANLDRINTLAEKSQGFLWRYLSSPGESALETRLLGADHIVTMSVWESIEHLHNYVYRSAHAPIMAKRKQWFAAMKEAHMVLWWIPAGTRPSLLEGSQRLAHLREHGPTETAFTFKQQWPAPDAAV